jgi:hypothetical protein
MEVTITIKPPPIAPDFSLSAISGGNFSAGTYTFGIYSHSGEGAGKYMYDSVGVEKQITLTAGQGVRFTWLSYDPLTTRFYIFQKTGTGYQDYDGGGGYSSTEGARLSQFPSFYDMKTNTFGSRLGTLRQYEPDNFFFGLRPDKGVGVIEILATSECSTFDIINAVKASAMVYREDYIAINSPQSLSAYSQYQLLTTYSLLINPTSTGRINLSSSTLLFLGGMYSVGGSEFYAEATRTTSTIFIFKRGGWASSTTLSKVNFTAVVFPFLQFYYQKNGFWWGISSGAAHTWSSGTAKYCFLQNYYGGFSKTQIDSVQVGNIIQLPSVNSDQPTRQVTYCSNLISYGSQPHKYFSDLSFNFTNVGFQFSLTGNGVNQIGYTNHFIDCNFFLNGVKMYRPLFYIYTYAANYGNPKVKLGNSANFTIVTESGAPIQGAILNIKDKEGVVVASSISDVNGVIEPLSIYWFSIELLAQTVAGVENDNNSIRIDSNPFTFEVTKTDYLPIKITNVQINSPLTQVISLKEIPTPKLFTRVLNFMGLKNSGAPLAGAEIEFNEKHGTTSADGSASFESPRKLVTNSDLTINEMEEVNPGVWVVADNVDNLEFTAPLEAPIFIDRSLKVAISQTQTISANVTSLINLKAKIYD